MAASILWLAIGGAQAGDWAGGWGGQGNCCCPPPRVKPPPPTVGVVYPICFYDVELGAVETARQAWPQYSKKLEAVLLGRVQNRKRVTIASSRSAVAWATKYTHRQIAGVWPEIACIGQSGGETSEQRRKVCVKFVRMQVKSNVEKASMPPGALEPVCQTFLTAQ
jgi:hypothetical protein